MEKSLNIYGLLIRKKRLFFAFFLLVFGISLIFNGLFLFYVDSVRMKSELTDSQIIERAKKLGMVEYKEYLENNQKHSKP